MSNTIKVLDHGFITLLNVAGPTGKAKDTDPAQCARISFNNFDSERTQEQDFKLNEYLIKNKHTTPIEMIETWWEMKIPIFIARQFIRHRTATVNEVSARYVTLPEEWYIPEVVGGKAKSKKQGQENNLHPADQEHFRKRLDSLCRESYSNYLFYINNGVAPEHARMLLHVNHYTHWIWKQDLHNLFHFLALRLHSHAQIEARIISQAMYDLLKQELPELIRLFDEYRRIKEA